MTEETPVKSLQTTMPMHDVRALLGPNGKAGLLLDGEVYTLRITQSGKLILTK
jgi:hemin uptake protein HemP